MLVKRLFTVFVGVLLFIFVGSLFANAATQGVSFSFTNGANPVSNITFFVVFPNGVVPVDLQPGMIWNAQLKTLSISVPKAEAYEVVNLAVDVDGAPGAYKLIGKLIGQWTQIGQNFQSDQIAIDTVISVPARERIIERIINNPAVIAAAKKVAAPTAIALEVAGGGALVSTLATSNASVAVNIAQSLRFIQFLSFGFFRLKKQKPWGRVSNRLTGKPIKAATIRVFEVIFKKLKDTQFTDADGRFGFLVSPGTYYITVSKVGFQEYKSELINVKDGAEALDINVQLISENGALLKTKSVIALMVKILNYLNPYILAFGTLAGIAVVIILPTIFNFIVLGTYVLLDLAKFFISRRTLKSFGRVIDRLTQQPIALAIIRIFDSERNWLLTSRVTDTEGRFRFLVVPGNYYITCAKEGYAPYISQPLNVGTSSTVSWDISLEKNNGISTAP